MVTYFLFFARSLRVCRAYPPLACPAGMWSSVMWQDT